MDPRRASRPRGTDRVGTFFGSTRAAATHGHRRAPRHGPDVVPERPDAPRAVAVQLGRGGRSRMAGRARARLSLLRIAATAALASRPVGSGCHLRSADVAMLHRDLAWPGVLQTFRHFV